MRGGQGNTMKKMRVRLQMESEGEQTSFDSEGLYEYGMEYSRIRFFADGVAYELLYDDSGLQIARKGDISYQLLFREQGLSACRIQTHYGAIEAQLCTIKLQTEFVPATVEVYAEYFLHMGGGRTKHSMRITAFPAFES